MSEPAVQFDSHLLRPVSRKGWLRTFIGLGRRYPLATSVLVIIFSNVLGTAFNFAYNILLIVHHHLKPEQIDIFWQVATIYNLIAWPIGLGVHTCVLWPIESAHIRMRRGESISPQQWQVCQRVLVTCPLYLIGINTLCWIPGAIVFPFFLPWLGGMDNATEIGWRFVASFVVSGLLTIVTTFFLVEEFLIRILYPIYFPRSSPAEVAGIPIPFFYRLAMLWMAVAAMPLIAILVVAWELHQSTYEYLFWIILITIGISLFFGGLICYIVGAGLLRWLKAHEAATNRIAAGNFLEPIRLPRPDEWGHLTDHFNNMMAALKAAEDMRETFGQIVHPKVRDAIMERFPQTTVVYQEISVLFADIRGFTKRTAGQPPEIVGPLLNSFLAQALAAVEDKAGLVNKFLGDGVMALFGAPEPRTDHADVAVAAAVTLLERVQQLNQELVQRGQPPLNIGIGIHSGLALVGCFGTAKRREFSAIGETVNLAQRMEQLTKTLASPILLSYSTRQKLTTAIPVESLGEQPLPGSNAIFEIFRVILTEPASASSLAGASSSSTGSR